MEEAADDRERNVRRKEMNGEERRKADRKGGDRWERVREKKTWHQTGGEHWSDAERLQESRRRTPVAPELFEMPFHILLKTFFISFLFTPSQLPSFILCTPPSLSFIFYSVTYLFCPFYFCLSNKFAPFSPLSLFFCLSVISLKTMHC